MDVTNAVLMGVVVLLSAVVAIQAIAYAKAMGRLAAMHAAQVDRLMVLQRSESLAEFAAAERQLAKERLEEARDPNQEPAPAVALKPKARSNHLGIWARYRAPVKE
jgi:hypothetical protein